MAAMSSNPGFWAAGLLGGQANQRASRRRLVVTPCVLYDHERRHIGLVRDISATGLFAYSDFTPGIGETLRVVLTEHIEGVTKTVSCTGIVVRVETKAVGAATGIALKVGGYEAA